MSKDERQRRRRVQWTWGELDRLAKIGPEGIRMKAADASKRMEGATLEEQERIAREAVTEIRQLIKPAVEKLHEAFNAVIVEATGMTLEDYLWLRDYEERE